MFKILKVYSYDCSNPMFMKLSDSCINIRKKYKCCRSRLSIYDSYKPKITHLYESRDFNVKKSNSVLYDLLSSTSIYIKIDNTSPHNNCDKTRHHNKYVKRKDIFVQMSRSKLHKIESRDPSYKAKEPVIIINQLSNIDVSSIVDDLLVDRDFNKVSSIFVVITSDDEVSAAVSRSRFNSTKCMQLSEYKDPWYKTAEQYWPQRQTSNTMDNLAVSLKGKQYFMAGIPTSTPYFTDENIRDKQNNFTPKHIVSKNKLCQITTPCNMIRIDMEQLQTKNNFASTDTTMDRPCCCKANPIFNDHNASDYNGYINSCATAVVSRILIASNSPPEDLISDAVDHLMPTQNNQALYLPENQIPGPMSTCQINQCFVRGKCCASQNVPAPEHKYSNRVKFQTSMEQSCKCNQDKLKAVFEETQTDKLRNMTSASYWEHSDLNHTTSGPTAGKDFHLKLNQNEYNSNTKKTSTIKPFLETRCYQPNTLRSKFRPKYSYSVGCQSAFKDIYNVIGPSGKTIPVLGQTITPFPGSSRRHISTGIQSGLGCLKCSEESSDLKQKVKYCKQSMPEDFSPTSHFKREVGLIEVIGPLGGYSAIGSGGAWTQAGHKELRVSTAIGPSNAYEQVDKVSMDASEKIDNTDNINVAVTNEKSKTNMIADEVKIDVTNNKNDVRDKKTKAYVDNMTLVEKIISIIKGDAVNSKDSADTLSKRNRLNSLFGLLNISKIKKKIKSNDESVQTEKSKRKTKCGCPKDIESMADFPYDEEDATGNAYIDPKLLLQLRSELCETTSGFVINKRGKKNEPAVELDVSLEDAIRYYAALHPEVLSDLIPVNDGPTNMKSCRCDRDTCCECPSNLMLEPPTDGVPSLFKFEGDDIDQPAVPFQGLSLKIPGKGTRS